MKNSIWSHVLHAFQAKPIKPNCKVLHVRNVISVAKTMKLRTFYDSALVKHCNTRRRHFPQSFRSPGSFCVLLSGHFIVSETHEMSVHVCHISTFFQEPHES